MAKFKVAEIVKAVNGELLCGRDCAITGVTIDSRRTPRGSVFVAIRGDRFNGHDFVGQALAGGSKAAIVEDISLLPPGISKPVILVKDTTRALQRLAAYHRSRFKKLLVIAVTGSNGKTTVKDMIASVFSLQARTLKTTGNLNNHIGAPLTILGLNDSHEVAVIEMGMNSPGEIRTLADIAKPSIGVITNIGSAHLGKLGSTASVRKAKAELLEKLGPKSTAVLNADDPNSRPLLRRWSGKTVTFGKGGSADVDLVDTWTNGKAGTWAVMQTGAREVTLHIPLAGYHNAENASAALAACYAAGVTLENIADGISRVKPAAMRMRFERLPNRALIVNDAYNANPLSVEAALKTVSERKAKGKTFFVFGDMLELGGKAQAEHKKIGKIAVKYGVDRIYALGELASITAMECASRGVYHYLGKTHKSIARRLAGQLKSGDIVLIKGSRGMAMEKVAERLKEIIKS